LLFICVWELLVSQIFFPTGILTPFFGATMSRTRFLQILYYLHFVDNSLAPRPDSPNFNKLYKIQPLLDLIIPRFRAVDETLIKFKGKVHFRQFTPIKPSRFGIKAFTLAESTSGYVLAESTSGYVLGSRV